MKTVMLLPGCDIVSAVEGIGFSCRRCGACCREDLLDPGVVLLSASELRRIMAATGLSREEFAGPYPDILPSRDGGRFTMAWCLHHRDGHCIFLGRDGCRIYSVRPWICRTFPFALDGSHLLVSECPGIGGPAQPGIAEEVACSLISRREAEEAEDEAIRRNLALYHIPAGTCAVVDSEGVWVQNG